MKNLSEILRNFTNQKVIVVGDVMIDESIVGGVSKISPEAPVQVVNVEKEIYQPGGAANVAANISSLQGKVSLFGFVGGDEHGKILEKMLNEKMVKCFFDKNLSTIRKVRVIARNQQLLRLDYEDDSSIKNFNSEILEKIEGEVVDSNIILVSDYAKGAINQKLMNFLKTLNKRILIDPKPQNIFNYKNSFLITPNETEALEMAHEKDVYSAGRAIKNKLNCNVIITQGEKGMTLFSDREMNIPTYAKEVYDVTGAGDTMIAALSLALASGASLEEAAIISNHAAGIAVSRRGTYQVKLGELEREIFGEEKKLKSFKELSEIISDLRKKNKTIVWTSGCFDILHSGHIKYLAKTKELGDYLVVGLNSDSSVRELKGPSRPINSEDTRAEILSSLSFVDYVMIFPESSPVKYLSVFKPEVYSKGGDYTLERIDTNEKRIVESYGGKIVLIDVGEDISTTKLIERIRKI